MLQRNGRTEAQGKEGKRCHVASSISSAFVTNGMASASAEEREQLTGPLFHVISQVRTKGGTEHGQN